MKVYVDDITLHLRGLGEELPKVAMGAFRKLKDVITRDGLLLFWNEGKKDGKSKINSSCECLAKGLKEPSRRAVAGHSDCAGNLGAWWPHGNEETWMKREGVEKEVRAEVCHYAEDESFPDREHEKRVVRKFLEMNLVPARLW